jgi:hypothetical protein
VTEHFDGGRSDSGHSDGGHSDGGHSDGGHSSNGHSDNGHSDKGRTGQRHDPDAAGPLAAEALRLVTSVQDWARRSFPEPSEPHGSDCQWCPLCQFVAVLRGERPEVTERVAEAGSAVVTALRSLLEAAAGPSGEAGGNHRADPPPPRVQHIRLDSES